MEFEAITGEIDKLGSLTDANVLWPVAIENGTVLLRDKSKDVLVAVYLARALFELDGYAGLVDGLTIIRDMLFSFWEGLYPESTRMRARASALQWLSDKMEPLVEESAFDADNVKSSLDRLNEIIAFTAEKFEPGEGPSLRPLARAFEAKLELAAQADGEPSGAGAEAAPAEGAPAGAPAAPRGPVASRPEAFKRLEEVVKFFKKTEPHSPVIYLLERSIRWKELSLQEIITEILITNRDVRNQIWQQFGLEREQN